MKFLVPIAIFTSLLGAQNQTGVSAEWDISKTVATLSDQVARLKPILDQLTPQEWVAKGAPDTSYCPVERR